MINSISSDVTQENTAMPALDDLTFFTSVVGTEGRVT